MTSWRLHSIPKIVTRKHSCCETRELNDRSGAFENRFLLNSTATERARQVFIMDFSVANLRLKENRKNPLSACWLAATTTNFLGSGNQKLTKTQIEKIDVVAVCDQLIENIKEPENRRLNLYLSSQLAYGASRIYRQQVCDLEDDCRKLLEDFASRFDEDLVEDLLIPEPPTYTEEEVIDYFINNKQKDTHQLKETAFAKITGDEVLADFGDFGDLVDPVPFCLDFDEIRMRSSYHESSEIADSRLNDNNVERQENRDVSTNLPAETTASIPSTPKRKSSKLLIETPSKRKCLLPTSLSELAKSPVSRSSTHRGLYQELPNLSQPMLADPAVGNTSRKSMISEFSIAEAYVPDEAAGTMLGSPQLVAQTAEDVQVPMDLPEELPQQVNEHMDISEPQQQSQDNVVPGATAMPPSLPPQAPVQNYDEQDHLTLEELEDEMLQSRPTHRRKNKKGVLIDDEKKLPSFTSLNFAFDLYTCTKKTKSLIKPIGKLPAKELLIAPAHGLKTHNFFKNKLHYSWGSTLLANYSNVLALCAEDFDGGARQSIARDIHVTNRRYSRLDIQKSLSSSGPSARLTRSESHLQTSNRQSSNIDLMPQPVATEQPMLLDQAPPGLPLRVSSDNTGPQVEQSLLEFEQTQDQLPPPPPLQVSSGGVEQEIQQSSTDDRTLNKSPTQDLMSIDELLQLLKYKWSIAEENLTQKSDEVVKVELKDLLPPESTTVNELFVYLHHLFSLEEKEILCFEQDIAYGPLYIIREDASLADMFK